MGLCGGRGPLKQTAGWFPRQQGCRKNGSALHESFSLYSTTRQQQKPAFCEAKAAPSLTNMTVVRQDSPGQCPHLYAIAGLLLLFCSQCGFPGAMSQLTPGDWEDYGVAASARDRRYLLYDVNPPEGFNLRRDVYIRMASLMKTLLKSSDWVLVLPPWGRLYHWQSPDIHQVRIPWSEFFDLDNLNDNIPVIEYEQFLEEAGGPFIEQVYVLQGYAEGWKEGTWEEKVDARPCIDQLMYSADRDGHYRGWFWGYEETRGLNVSCLSVQGSASVVAPVLLENTSARSVMIDRAENLLHDHYGGKDYWNLLQPHLEEG